jgi:hypothetical protein
LQIEKRGHFLAISHELPTDWFTQDVHPWSMIPKSCRFFGQDHAQNQ